MVLVNYEIPKTGQMVVVRARPAVVRDVKAFAASDNVTSHSVQVEYLDGWQYPETDNLIWEREVRAQIIKGYVPSFYSKMVCHYIAKGCNYELIVLEFDTQQNSSKVLKVKLICDKLCK